MHQIRIPWFKKPRSTKFHENCTNRIKNKTVRIIASMPVKGLMKIHWILFKNFPIIANYTSSPGVSESDLMEDVPEWKGISMDEIYKGLGPFGYQQHPPISPSENHTVLFLVSLHPTKCPTRDPKPRSYRNFLTIVFCNFSYLWPGGALQNLTLPPTMPTNGASDTFECPTPHTVSIQSSIPMALENSDCDGKLFKKHCYKASYPAPNLRLPFYPTTTNTLSVGTFVLFIISSPRYLQQNLHSLLFNYKVLNFEFLLIKFCLNPLTENPKEIMKSTWE